MRRPHVLGYGNQDPSQQVLHYRPGHGDGRGGLRAHLEELGHPSQSDKSLSFYFEILEHSLCGALPLQVVGGRGGSAASRGVCFGGGRRAGQGRVQHLSAKFYRPASES